MCEREKGQDLESEQERIARGREKSRAIEWEVNQERENGKS